MKFLFGIKNQEVYYMKIENLVEEVKVIAKNAGAAIMKIYTDADLSQVVDYKADDSPLTLADEAADKVIKKGLEELPVQYPILSEEGKKMSYEERKDWDTFWLVDPLDGTKEFIKKMGSLQ